MNAKETGNDNLAIRALLRGRTEKLAILFLPPSALPVALAIEALDTLADFDNTLALLGCPAELLTIPKNPNYGRIHLVALHGIRLAS
jgi:hypothetical protein